MLVLAGPAFGQAARPAGAEAMPEMGSPEAAQYLALLARTGETLPAEEAAALHEHLARLALILPDAVRARVAEEGWEADPASARFAPDAAAVLLAWWRSQDPLPLSAANERLDEHLARSAHAEAEYAHPDAATGLDARGEVYVRYGEPTRVRAISFNDPKLIDTVYQAGLTVSPSDFPVSEFWVYQHVDRGGYFLFAEHDERFEQAEVLDLMPTMLRSGFQTGRGAIRALMALAVLRTIYEQLATEHIDFGARYNAVDQYVLLLEEGTYNLELSTRVKQERRQQTALIGETITDEGDRGLSGALPDGTLSPGAFVESILYQGRTEDAAGTWRRDRTMPAQYTEALGEAEALPVAVRATRFLDDDGTTRTVLDWSPEPGGLAVAGTTKAARRQLAAWPTGQFVVALTAAQQTDDYRTRHLGQQPYLIADLDGGSEAVIPAQTMTVHGDTGRYHLALQWDQYLARASEAEGVALGPKVKVGTARIDSLTALSADARVLEMSDLRPLFVHDLDAYLATEDPAAATPYPHPAAWAAMPLALYFEVYHLAFGPDDRTHYTVSYEVVRGEAERPGLRLRRRARETTAAETEYSGTTRTVRDFILLDLSGWEGRGEIEVRVRVTDDVTGRSVVRALPFTLTS